jgi:hypothetical protein
MILVFPKGHIWLRAARFSLCRQRHGQVVESRIRPAPQKNRKQLGQAEAILVSMILGPGIFSFHHPRNGRRNAVPFYLKFLAPTVVNGVPD